MARGFAKDQPQGFLNRIERIAVIGAGGQFGKCLTEPLLKTGKHVVTAITRPESTSKLPNGVRVARIDYSGDDDTALVDVLRGQQALIITMAIGAPRDTINKLSAAAAKAEVPYVLPNWYGVDDANTAFCDDVGLSAAAESIKIQFSQFENTAYIFLVCTFWYEFSLGGGTARYGFDFKERKFIQFDDGNVKFPTTTWPQCGRAIASLFSLKELPEDEDDHSPTISLFANRSLYISSFRANQHDIFASIKRVTGTSDADWTMTHESAEKRWSGANHAVQNGDFSQFPKRLYSRIFFPNGDGALLGSELHNELLGLPVEDLDEYTAIAVRMGENDEVVSDH